MIRCDLHDYVEIACMYRYRVMLTRKSGETIQGIASDTKYDSERQECIELSIDEDQVMVPLDRLSSMQALDDNPHFDLVHF